MATKKSAAHKRRLLSSTRPKTVDHRRIALPSSQHSRALIRKYHTLEKQQAQAICAHDADRATSIQAKIERLGGLSSYQRASIAGQSIERGGDSSKLLIRWLAPVISAPPRSKAADERLTRNAPRRKLRLLEVGALSPDNACAKSGMFEMERIDLLSRHHSIKQQDFMDRPVPGSEVALDQEGFDVVSLSLVLNFVPDAAGRGAMLQRISSFLRRQRSGLPDTSESNEELFPSLFLVLPAPCVLNSRYLDEERLEAILESLGYGMARKKMSRKLVFYLWRYVENREAEKKVFKKEGVRAGGGRNNFAITLR